MIAAQQFKERWEANQNDRLVAFPASSLIDVNAASEVKAFLIEAGLPKQAAPFLVFGPPKTGTLQRVSNVWHQSEAFSGYRIIGGNGSGDPVCLEEEANGQIVYLNHDNRFERQVMASSVFTLAECLVELRDVVASAGGDTELVTAGQYAELLARFRQIDPVASGEGGFWEQEFECFRPVAKKPWWQFSRG